MNQMLKRMIACVMLGMLAIPLSVMAQTTPTIDPASVTLTPMMTDLTRPLYVTNAGDGTNRLFVMQQGGVIFVMDGADTSVFLDLTEKVTWDANGDGYTERGLLGIAFAPDYAESGRFYVNYTDRAGNTVIARYTVSADPNVADADSEEILIQVEQPFPNHNGGELAFGADGFLYIGLGDGGAANDPLGAGQNLGTLLGKILRIDVSAESGYSIPESNPFVSIADARGEIWAYGLRNPWRFSFDSETNDLYIADVGQNEFEEVNFQAGDSAGGENYGWVAFEANARFNASVEAINPIMPVAEYSHGAAGCSVTGGYVYRGEALPELQGVYFYGDYCSGRIWSLYRDATGNWVNELFLETGFSISSFGLDEAGELYVVNYNGEVLRLDPAQ
jgi:glucose/arabinose dehydrogenase